MNQRNLLFLLFFLGACAGTESDDDDSKVQSSRDGGVVQQTPRDGGEQQTPRDGGEQQTPRDGGEQQTPRDGGEQQTPRDGGTRPVACDPSFGAAEACGGDPVGVWTYRVACTDEDVFAAAVQACPGAVVSNQVVSTGGTVTIDANGTFVRDVTTDVGADSSWPQVCVQPFGTCAGLQAFINGNTTVVAACTPNGSGCDCGLTTTIVRIDGGNYVVSGGTITADGYEYHFCAELGVFEYHGTANNAADNTFTFVMTP